MIGQWRKIALFSHTARRRVPICRTDSASDLDGWKRVEELGSTSIWYVVMRLSVLNQGTR